MAKNSKGTAKTVKKTAKPKSKAVSSSAPKVVGKPFKKGESGNPNGRPKGQRDYATIYREALIKLADMNDVSPDDLETDILLKGLASARKGDYRFWKDVHDRLHGTATQNLDHKSDGMPIQSNSIAFVTMKPDGADSK